MWLDVDKVLICAVCVLKYILHYKDVGNTIHSLLKTSQLNKVFALFHDELYVQFALGDGSCPRS